MRECVLLSRCIFICLYWLIFVVNMVFVVFYVGWLFVNWFLIVYIEKGLVGMGIVLLVLSRVCICVCSFGVVVGMIWLIMLEGKVIVWLRNVRVLVFLVFGSLCRNLCISFLVCLLFVVRLL